MTQIYILKFKKKLVEISSPTANEIYPPSVDEISRTSEKNFVEINGNLKTINFVSSRSERAYFVPTQRRGIFRLRSKHISMNLDFSFILFQKK